MEIFQEEMEFKPICITLNTREEASTFLGIIDKMDSYSSLGFIQNLDITSDEYDLITKISDAFTLGKVKI